MLQARRITKDELALTGEVFRIAFELPNEKAEDNAAMLKWMEENPQNRGSRYALEKWAAFDEEGNMAAWIGGMRYTVRFDGNEFPMSGIGGVSSLPQYRRQGGIRLCFEELLRSNYDDGVVLSYLFPFSTEFYGKFGYEPTGRVKTYSIPLRALSAEHVGGTVRPHKCGSRKADIIKVYEDYACRYNYSCVRDEGDWAFLDKSDMSKSGEYIYVWYNNAGEAKGVIGFRQVKNPTEKFDIQTGSMFWFSDEEGLRGLLEFARGFETYYKNLIIRMSSDFPLCAYVRELEMYPQECREYHMGMARVINVQKVLEAAAYRGTGSLKLQILDPALPENNKTFSVSFADGKAEAVSETEEEADIVLPIGIFSKFIAGDQDAKYLSCYPGVEILHDTAAIEQVFYQKPLLIMDAF